MQITIQTKDGQILDLSNVKYMEMDGQRFAIMPVASKVKVSKVAKTGRKLPENTTAAKVRNWLDSATVGDVEYIRAPSRYAISAPAEMRNQQVKIKPLANGSFKCTYMGTKLYARSAY